MTGKFNVQILEEKIFKNTKEANAQLRFLKRSKRDVNKMGVVQIVVAGRTILQKWLQTKL